MSDDQKRDDQARPTEPTPTTGDTAPDTTPEATRPAAAVRPRPLPPTWMDLSPEDVERLTRQVERAFSSEPFRPLAQTGGGRGASPPVEAGGREPTDEAARGERWRPDQEPAPSAAVADTAVPGEPEDETPEGRATPEGREGRRRRRGSRGRGRRRRREGALPPPVNDLDVMGDPEVAFAEAAAAPVIPVERTGEAAAVVEGAAEADEAVTRPDFEAAEAGESRRVRRRRGRRGRDREERRAGGEEGRPAAEGRGGAAAAEEEPELRVLEEALRAGQPRSAADIGAFDEREQALLKDAWPDAPVREGQGPMRRRSQHGLSMEETFEARREKMAEERRARKGTLYVVATPIGNLEDITFRAVRVLKEVKLIAAEDTRQTAKLLNHYQIRTPLTSFFEHNEQLKIEPLLRRLDDGQAIALVSDAGTPGISDPGYTLVKAAVDRGASVVAVPGACAAVAALSTSGLPTDAWAFVGFLPQKDKKRKEILESLKLDRRTLVFYEAPGRAYETIQELCDLLGNRDLVMFREITKVHEEAVRGKFSKVLAEYRGKEIKGEVVLVVAGWQGKLADREGLSILDRLRLYKQESGLPLADVVRLVARETGTPKSDVYRESLKLVGVDPEKIRATRTVESDIASAQEVATPRPPAREPAAAASRSEVVAAGSTEPEPFAAEAEPSVAQAGATSALSAQEQEDAASRSAGEEEVAPPSSNGVRASVVLTDTVAAAEPDLVAEPDARQRMSEEAQPDAPDVRGPDAPDTPSPDDPSAVPGVEIVEGRPGGVPQIPLAPRQD